MYENFYGFAEKPFSMTPDPAFLYLSDKHSTGLTMLQYGLLNRAGMTVLTGDIGSGKTTLMRYLLSEMDDEVTVGLISNTHKSFGSLMQWVSVAFGLSASSRSKAVLHDRFVQFLVNEFAAGRRSVLIVDEAQNLDETTLEELRLLTNINADKDQLLQLVLVGQSELREKLRRPRLVQFAQRIGVDFHLTPLNGVDTESYINHRLVVAGGKPGLFDRVACRFICYQTGGIPRLINSMCDTALVYAFSDGRNVVNVEIVYDMVVERISAGLFGGGVADAEEEGGSDALDRANANLTRARNELPPETGNSARSGDDEDTRPVRR